MKLRTLAPLVRAVNTRTARLPRKQKEAVYDTPQFRAWRAQVVARAGGQCQAQEDGQRCRKAEPEHVLYADHVHELRDGGAPFDINNGQALCAVHHGLKTAEARKRRQA